MKHIEDEFFDVLHNIESGIMSVFGEHPELTDWEVQRAFEGLIRTYRAEETDHPAPALTMNPLAQTVFERVHLMCEFRLGREQLVTKKGKPAKIPMQPLTVTEILACLKRIRSSVELWNKEGGRQGYLNYVSQFMS